MRKLVAILLLNAMLLQLSNKLGILTWFKINQKEIIELFCINKNKPQLACDGKCYLKNKLQKADTENNIPATQNSQIKHVTEELFINEIYLSTLILPIQKIYYPNLNNLYKFSLSFTNFHPPQV